MLFVLSMGCVTTCAHPDSDKRLSDGLSPKSFLVTHCTALKKSAAEEVTAVKKTKKPMMLWERLEKSQDGKRAHDCASKRGCPEKRIPLDWVRVTQL